MELYKQVFNQEPIPSEFNELLKTYGSEVVEQMLVYFSKHYHKPNYGSGLKNNVPGLLWTLGAKWNRNRTFFK